MTEIEFELLKTLIADLKTGLTEFKEEVNNKIEGMGKKIDEFITNHPRTCYFLIWQKGRWRKLGRAIMIAGIVVATPAFILGLIEIAKLVLGVK